MRYAILAVGLALPAVASAEPLRFGTIGAGAKPVAADLRDCGEAAGARTCKLTRTEFGGLPIEESQLTLDARGYARSLRILLDDADFDTARRLLTGRYGAPAQASPGDRATRWTGFAGGGAIELTRRNGSAIILFRLPEPVSAAPDALPILLFGALGAGAGAVIWRLRRRRQEPVPAAAEPSMRETLERRLREGREIRF